MAKKKTAVKTTKKANLDLEGLKSSKISTKTKKSANKVAKTVGAKVLLFGLVFLFVGLFFGAGTWWIVCRNDCFELLGQEEVCLTVEERYQDEGAKIISFGKNIADEYFIDTNLEIDDNGNFFSDEVGTFFIKYYTKDFKYGKLFKIEKIRLITFVEVSEGEI